MGTPFSDSVIGGNNELIRDSIHSPNYVAAQSGWSINRDGTAQFDDIRIFGTVYRGGLTTISGIAPQHPGYQNGWTDYGSGFQQGAFALLPFGMAMLVGVVKNGTLGTTVTQIPAAFRPVTDHTFICPANDGKKLQVVVNDNGVIASQNADTGVTWFSFGCIMWPTAEFPITVV